MKVEGAMTPRIGKSSSKRDLRAAHFIERLHRRPPVPWTLLKPFQLLQTVAKVSSSRRSSSALDPSLLTTPPSPTSKIGREKARKEKEKVDKAACEVRKSVKKDAKKDERGERSGRRGH